MAFGRDMSVFGKAGVVAGNIVLDSATRTMESIRYCCMNANFADAYTFLSKFRDDLLYCIYLFAVVHKSDITQFVESDKLITDEKNIWDWIHNLQDNLHMELLLL